MPEWLNVGAHSHHLREIIAQDSWNPAGAISTQSRTRPLRKFGCGRAGCGASLRCFLSHLVRNVRPGICAVSEAETDTSRWNALRRAHALGVPHHVASFISSWCATRKYPLTRMTRVRFFIPYIFVRESEAPLSLSFRLYDKRSHWKRDWRNNKVNTGVAQCEVIFIK